jgi:hypothetical protein
MEKASGMRVKFHLPFHTIPNRAQDVPVDRGQHLVQQLLRIGDL